MNNDTNVKKIRDELDLFKELEKANKENEKLKNKLKDYEELKSQSKEFKKLNSENGKLKEKINKYENNLYSNDVYKYNNNGDITGFFPDIATDKFLIENKMIFSGGRFYSYDNGVYKNKEEEVLKRVIHKKLLHTKDPYIISNMENMLKLISTKKYVNANMINNSSNINMKNGYLDVDKFDLIKHTPSIYNTLQLNCNYKSFNKNDIKNTLFIKFLKESTNNSDSLIDYIKQVFGYLFSNYVEAQKMFILKGVPKTGKSTFLNIIRAFYDVDFISNVDLKNLTKGEYIARLHGKALNICGDIGQNYIDDTSLILQLIGEDDIEARPLYSNPFAFKNKARCLFSTNSLPNVNDKSGAFLRRCAIIPFNNKISEEKKDTKLLQKIIDKELDIIGSWAIDGLKELKLNSFKFNKCDDVRIEMDNYKLENNNIEKFITEYCHIDTNNSNIFIVKSEFNKMYKMWCNEENRNVLSSRHIEDTIKKYNLEEKRSYLHTSRYYTSIAWKETIQSDFESDYNFKYTKGIESTIIKNEDIELNNYKKYEKIELFFKEKIIYFQDRSGLSENLRNYYAEILTKLYFNKDTKLFEKYKKRITEKPDKELIPELLIELGEIKKDTSSTKTSI